MFTGIIERTTTVSGTSVSDGGRRIRFRSPFPDLSHGQSISINGVCLTVEESNEDWFEVFTATETLSKTYLDELEKGDLVNLERALLATDRLDGHFVQGHVDTTIPIEDIEQIGEDWLFYFEMPTRHEQYISSRGSVALDGISLTVAELNTDSFTVTIIPTTYEDTNLHTKNPGDVVHFEADILAKYVERQIEHHSKSDSAPTR
ncbi:MAG: riboflavin synthase [Halobacteriaceae archaeon]